MEESSVYVCWTSKTINDSLHLLLAKQLIVCKINQNENMYLLSNIGNALVTELATEVYAVKLYKAIHQTDIILHDIAKEQLLSYINSQIWDSWWITMDYI